MNQVDSADDLTGRDRPKAERQCPSDSDQSSISGLNDIIDGKEAYYKGVFKDGDHTRRHFFAVAEIDHFVTLKNTIGYALASQTISSVAARISAGLPNSEIGRVGGNSIEFAFVASCAEQAQSLLHTLLTKVARPVDIEGFRFDLHLTIGVVDAGRGTITAEIIDFADAALLRARAEHVRIGFADDRPAGAATERLTLMRDLQNAAELGQLTLLYQPKLRCRTGKIDTVEALIRWCHPVRGMVSPDHFIPLAETTGEIRSLTEWVIARAKRDLKVLASAGCPVSIDVNISGTLLPDPDFTAFALRALKGYECSIGFEITETALIVDPAGAFKNLSILASAGIKLAIDDYGSGFSSLAYLQRLPVRELKIDKVFIAGLAQSNRDPLIVRSTIDLAHALDMEVTAEGVDTPEALALLKVMGCDLVQGYLIGKPISVGELEHFILDGQHHVNVSAQPDRGDALRKRLLERGQRKL